MSVATPPRQPHGSETEDPLLGFTGFRAGVVAGGCCAIRLAPKLWEDWPANERRDATSQPLSAVNGQGSYRVLPSFIQFYRVSRCLRDILRVDRVDNAFYRAYRIRPDENWPGPL